MTFKNDLDFMREAYREALRAVGNADPNPAVGAVIVSPDGQILASGFTQPVGLAHAERHALGQVPDIDLSGATLYATLEPCCHHGRTPPCVDAILERKIKRVVIAERDFAAEVMGRSVALLQEKGVEVNLLEPSFFANETWLTTGSFFFARKHARPRVTLKWAQTNDGAIAPQSGPSRSISGEKAAFVTAALRSFHKLTVATPGTVTIDKPKLTVRFHSQPDFKNSGLSDLFLGLLLLQKTQPALKPAAQSFMQSTADLRQNFSVAMSALLGKFLAQGFNSVLIEAGPVFSQLLLDNGFVDALAVYRSKKKTSTMLWGTPGRGNNMSTLLAQTESVPDFIEIEKADLDDDDFLFFRHV